MFWANSEIARDRDIYHAAIHEVAESHQGHELVTEPQNPFNFKRPSKFQKDGLSPMARSLHDSFQAVMPVSSLHTFFCVCFVEPSGANSFRIKTISVAYE